MREHTKSDVGVIGDFSPRLLGHNLHPFDADELSDAYAEIENRTALKLRVGGRVWFCIFATIHGQN